jgi:hypothetical protein
VSSAHWALSTLGSGVLLQASFLQLGASRAQGASGMQGSWGLPELQSVSGLQGASGLHASSCRPQEGSLGLQGGEQGELGLHVTGGGAGKTSFKAGLSFWLFLAHVWQHHWQHLWRFAVEPREQVRRGR